MHRDAYQTLRTSMLSIVSLSPVQHGFKLVRMVRIVLPIRLAIQVMISNNLRLLYGQVPVNIIPQL